MVVVELNHGSPVRMKLDSVSRRWGSSAATAATKKAAAVVKNDYVPIDFSKSVEKVPFGEEEEEEKKGPNIGAVWGLLILSVAYLHHSTTGFALPALLPIISSDLHLQDSQGALLTAGYTILYALLCIKSVWFGELLAARIGFAAAQATQNPICFSLIPEMFPKGRTTAMAVYNSAIYVGRAFSFAALVIAGKLGVPQGIMENLDIAYTLVPLDKVDLSLVTIMYTQGDYAAVSPIFTYTQDVGDAGVALESAFGAWRQLLSWLGPPGIVIAVLCLLTIDETRPRNKGFLGDPIKSSRFLSRTTSSEALVAPAPEHMSTTQSLAESMDKLKVLIRDPAFLSLTIASTFNDVGSWARLHGKQHFINACMSYRLRRWITAGANIAAAPCIALSILAPDYKQSFAALLIGFALSEAWRAPAAVAVREVSPPGLGSTGSAVHLSIRNVIGGLGPLAVALIASKTDLQNAMLLVPACYLASGFGFLLTEFVIATQDKKV
eukprot:jgi/Picre1/27379/NNA_000346.t1